MDFAYLYGSSEGRIARREFWIGVLGLVVVGAVCGFLLASTVGATSRTGLLFSLAVNVFLFFPTYALNAKRFHDRDRPGWFALVLLVPSVLLTALHAFGVADAGWSDSALGKVYHLAVAVVGIWFFVELGFLKGTDGSNRYGPDPIEHPVAA